MNTSVVSYEATDACLNLANCSFNVTVNSTNSSLVLDCPADINVTVPVGTAGQNLSWTAPTGSSDCVIGSVTTTQTAGILNGDFFPVGSYTITYESTDGCGATTTCSFTIVVSEGVGTLTLDCPVDLVYVLPLGSTSMPVSWESPITSTTCGGGQVNPNCGTNPAGFTFIGTLNDQEYYLSNSKSPWTVAQANCEVYDGYLPTINSQEENDFLLANINSVIHIGLNDIATEGTYEWINGEPVTFTNFTSNPSNSADNDYGHMQNWDGDWDVYSNLVWKNYVMELDCGGGSSIDLEQTSGPANGSNFTEGIYTITYQASDDCGDVQTCSFTIEIQDNSPDLVITCPSNITVQEVPGTGAATVNWSSPTATTSCVTGGLNITQTGGLPSGSSFAIGTYTISYQGTDDCGNVATCSFTVSVDPDSQQTEYCEAKGNTPWQQWISNVSLNTINNSSGKDQYGDFTDLNTNLLEGNSYTFSLTPSFSWTQWDEYVRVWIDYNGDFDFTDPGELVVEEIIPGGAPGSGGQTLNSTIIIPVSVASGATRMRVAMKKEAYAGSCETFDFGEVEDYTIIINSPDLYLSPEGHTEILFFNAQESGREVRFNWMTNTEFKNDYFVLERSQDGRNFELLKEINSISENIVETYYQDKDLQPKQGQNYYRLHQVNYDGSSRYSNVEMIEFNVDLKHFEMIPNPASEEVYLHLKNYHGLSANIQIMNALGQTMLEKRIDEVSDSAIRLDLSEFYNGVYFVSVQLDKKKRVTKQLVISRTY